MSSSTTRLGRLLGMVKAAGTTYYINGFDADADEQIMKALNDRNGKLVIGGGKPGAPTVSAEELADSVKQQMAELNNRDKMTNAAVGDEYKSISDGLKKARANEAKFAKRLGMGAAALAVPGLAYLGYRALSGKKKKGKR